MGFSLADIAVLSWRGRESSQVLKADSLGPWTLRKATGQRDADGDEIYTRGELLCETVHRFKGQAVGAIVFTEMELSAAPVVEDDVEVRARQENHWHRVYVGLTRAQAYVGMVMSVGAERAMLARLSF